MKKMKFIQNYEGYGIGQIVTYDKKSVKKTLGLGYEAELERFNDVKKKALASLDESYHQAKDQLGEKNAAIFLTHKLMIEDEDFFSLIDKELKENVNLEYAIYNASEKLANNIHLLEDHYMRERANDIKDISSLLLSLLNKDDNFDLKEKSIIIAKDLPVDILLKLDRKMILGLVLLNTSIYSHVAIIAKMLEIPSLCAIGNTKDEIKGLGIIDAIDEKLIINPKQKEIENYNKKIKDYYEKKAQLEAFRGKDVSSIDGKTLELYANISSCLETQKVLNSDALGIGLFRSEFLYLNQDNFPTEDEQFEQFKYVLNLMKDKPVIIRTFDISSDKLPTYIKPSEIDDNSRAISFYKKYSDIFLHHLKALYRSSIYGNLAIMIPMVKDINDVKFIYQMIDKAKIDLKQDEILFKDIDVGIMVETKEAVDNSIKLAEMVSFFSIGTNDLIQNTLNINRDDPNLKTVLKNNRNIIADLIENTVKNAHQAGIKVGICGELAKDPDWIPFFLHIGVDILSMNPGNILSVKKIIAETNTSKLKQI